MEKTMARPKGTTRAKKPIQKKEFELLLRATKNSLTIKSATRVKLQRAFTLLYLTGCRISEIANFSTSELNQFIQRGEFSLTNKTKMKKPRLITLDEGGVQAQMLKEILPKDEVFLFTKNNSSKPMRADSLKLLMNNFIHSILGELYSTHSFRAGYITTQHQANMSLEFIREDVGHANIATTARYATVTQKEISRGKNNISW